MVIASCSSKYFNSFSLSSAICHKWFVSSSCSDSLRFSEQILTICMYRNVKTRPKWCLNFLTFDTFSNFISEVFIVFWMENFCTCLINNLTIYHDRIGCFNLKTRSAIFLRHFGFVHILLILDWICKFIETINLIYGIRIPFSDISRNILTLNPQDHVPVYLNVSIIDSNKRTTFNWLCHMLCPTVAFSALSFDRTR